MDVLGSNNTVVVLVVFFRHKVTHIAVSAVVIFAEHSKDRGRTVGRTRTESVNVLSPQAFNQTNG